MSRLFDRWRHRKERSARPGVYAQVPLPGPGYIRLLTLAPGKGNDRLECSLAVHQLSSADAYDAVSYVWGLQVKQTALSCNGVLTTIGPSLAWGLRRIRSPTASLRLWLDALCIDQSDDAEKNSQVRLMRQIYARADTVLLWLGPDVNDNGGRAIELLKRLERIARAEVGGHQVPTGSTLADVPFSQAAHEQRGLPPLRGPEWDAVREFLRNDWFKRLWVVQEASAARRAMAYYGDREVAWSTIGAASAWMWRKHYLRHPTGDDQDILLRGANIWATSQESYGYEAALRLSSVLGMSKNYECQDPRDKIFALLGITIEGLGLEGSGEPRDLRPDYTKSVLGVYTAAARYLVNEDEFTIGPPSKPASMMHLWWYLPEHDPDWPSWVPRWDTEHQPVLCKWKHMGYSYFAARTTKVQTRTSASESVLSIRGLLVDVLESVDHSLVFHGRVSEEDWPLAVRRLWIQYLEMVKTRDPVAADVDEIRQTANFAQTVAGCSIYLRTTDEKVVRDFAAWYGRAINNAVADMLARAVSEQELAEYMQHSAVPAAPDATEAHAAEYDKAFQSRNRVPLAFGISRKGFIGRMRAFAKPGDAICVLYGCPIPVLLQPVAGHYRFGGFCHLPGLMEGRALDMLAAGSAEETWFEIH